MSLSKDTRHVFRGDPKSRPEHPHPDSLQEPEPYVAPPELVQAVNLAIYLRRPLLLEGEAGCGKTRLARAVAYELGLPFYPWYVRSTNKAQEGLYTYDAVLRLHDVQVHQYGLSTGGEGARDPTDPKAYRRFGPLGKAFRVEECPAVVLIDEIDKADIDFPNDLLAVLDDPWTFEIHETGETIRARHEPIVIITSNKEKGNLPAPFLRRCIYFFVSFPSERLKEIVDAHYREPEASPPAPELVEAATRRFLAIREDSALFKKPGTSEFLDWLEALRGFAIPGQESLPLALGGSVPHPSLLFKLRADWSRYVEGVPAD